MDDTLLDSMPLAGGPTPREALADLAPYDALAVEESHHAHHHPRDEDAVCDYPDVAIWIERSARQELWLWSAGDGSIERAPGDALLHCDERCKKL